MVLCWIIVAIRKHIASKEPLTSGGKDIRIQEPLNDGVIVAGLEVIPSSVAGMEVSFSCYLDRKSIEKVAIIPVLMVALSLVGTTIQGLT